MTCVICKTGITEHGLKSFMLEKGSSILIVKDVPAQVCNQCGEAYFDAPVTKALYTLAQNSFKTGAELEVIKLGPLAA